MKATVIQPKKAVEETKQKIRVAAYARVSTNSSGQEESYENQVRYYESMIQNNPNYEFVGVYADQAISGTTDKRPGFMEMIRQAERHNIDLIITKSISRFSRNVADLHKYTQKLQLLGVNVRFEEENIEIKGAQGTLLLSILGAIAQMEVENTSAHVNWTLQNKMNNGELVGQANPLGYDVVVESEQTENGETVIKKKLVINEQEAEIVRYIFKRYLEGIGTHTIGNELRSMGIRTRRDKATWHDSTITGILKNEKYTGTLLQGKTYTVTPIDGGIRKKNVGDKPMYEVKQNHEAIVSLEDFKRVQEIMNSRCVTYKDGRKKGTTRNSNQSVFTSKIKCQYCGKNFVRRIVHPGTNSEKVIWQCATYAKRGKEHCPYCKSIDEEFIKKAFVQLVSELLVNTEYPYYLSDERFKSHLRKTAEDNSIIELQIQEMEKALLENERKRQKLIDSMLNEKITQEEFDIQIKLLRKDMEQQQDMIQCFRQEYDYKERQVKSIQEIRELVHNGDINGFNARLFNLLVDHIDIGGYERNTEGVLISNPKKVDFVLNYDNLDQHSFDYYWENRAVFEKLTRATPVTEQDTKQLEDMIFGLSKEEKEEALEHARQKTKG